jgi:hypothetical protein
MQIKYYTILPGADIEVIRAWVDDPDHHCTIITQGREGHVTHNLCVRQPLHSLDIIAPTEDHLAGMIEETSWPE